MAIRGIERVPEHPHNDKVFIEDVRVRDHPGDRDQGTRTQIPPHFPLPRVDILKNQHRHLACNDEKSLILRMIVVPAHIRTVRSIFETEYIYVPRLKKLTIKKIEDVPTLIRGARFDRANTPIKFHALSLLIYQQSHCEQSHFFFSRQYNTKSADKQSRAPVDKPHAIAEH